MTNKRFGYGAGVNWQEDIIIDYETEKSYDFYEVGGLLNELAEENEQLKQVAEKNKKLKQEIASENSILWNEILKLQKQGALPSNTFKNYLNDLKKEKKIKVVLHG